MSELLTEAQLYPQEVVDVVSAEVGVARANYIEEQSRRAEDLRHELSVDEWLTIHYTVCDTISLTDSEVWSHANHYDEGEIPEDGIAAEERRYWGSLLDRNAEWFAAYSQLNKTRGNAEILSMDQLRRELAARTVRLACLTHMSPEEYANRWQNYKLLEIAALTSSITGTVWKRLTGLSSDSL